MVYTWIAIIVLAAVIELWLRDLVTAWLIPAAAVALVLELFSVDVWLQAIVFAVLSLGGILFLRRLLCAPRKKTMHAGPEAVIGEKAVVTERIDNSAGMGQVTVGGMYWAARASDDEVLYEPDDAVTILAVEGVMLIVR